MDTEPLTETEDERAPVDLMASSDLVQKATIHNPEQEEVKKALQRPSQTIKKDEVTLAEGITGNLEENITVKKTDGKRPYPESVLTHSDTASVIAESQTSTTDPSEQNPPDCPGNFTITKNKTHTSRRDYQNKKAKTDSSKDNYSGLEKAWEDGSNHPLSYLDFEQFLCEVKGSDNPVEIAKRYTSDLKALIRLIHTVAPQISQRALKQRSLRLAATLRQNLPLEEAEELCKTRLSQTSLTRKSSCESLSSESN